MRKSLILIVVGCIAAIALLMQRPWSSPSIVRTPDEKHIHQVYGSILLTQRVLAPTDSIDGWFVYTDKLPNELATTPVVLHIRPAGQQSDIRTVATTFSDAYIETPSGLQFAFVSIQGIGGQVFDITLEAPSLTQKNPLRVRYQSDPTLYSSGQSFSSQGQKQGNLGFKLYEQPYVITRLWRWMIHPDNRLVWPALVLVLSGALGWRKLHKSWPQSEAAWQDPWQNISQRKVLIAGAYIFLAAFIIYAPAFKLFYFHDDIALLARAKHFDATGTWQLLTSRSYLESDTHSRFALPHWRPLSAGFYAWLTWHVFGLHAGAALAANLSLVALTGVGLYILGWLILRQEAASLLATTMWLVHSTRVGVVYWWSSSHDILASLFLVFSLVTYTRWRATGKMVYLAGALTLFAAGLLSKEQVILLPFLLLALEFLVSSPKFKYIAPFVCIAGIFLVLRTVALSDPALPQQLHDDKTYELTVNPASIAKNTTALLNWTAENWLWPKSTVLQDWIYPVRATLPLYPAFVIVAVYITCLLVFWKNKPTRHIVLFAGLWWLLTLGPTLLLAHVWFDRWLYLPVFAVGIGIAMLYQKLPRGIHAPVAVGLISILLLYGFWQARLPERTRLYREQSAYSWQALQQFTNQRSHFQPDSTVYLTGVTEEQTTSINSYLFTLATSQPFTLVRTDTPPNSRLPHDVVITMSGYNAYYPENDI